MLRSEIIELQKRVAYGKSYLNSLDEDLNKLLKNIDQGKEEPVADLKLKSDLKKLLDIVELNFGIAPERMKSRSRKRTLSNIRFMLMKILKQQPSKYTLKDIGKCFSNRDHSSVLHAVSKADVFIETEEEFKNKYETILRLFNQPLLVEV